jgi:hypothetical protein
MNSHADKTQENKSQSRDSARSQKQSANASTFQFEDSRPDLIVQRKLKEMTDKSPQSSQLNAFQNMATNSQNVKQVTQLQAKANTYSSQQNQPIQKKEARLVKEEESEFSPLSESSTIQRVKITEEGAADENVKRSYIGFTKVFLGKHVAQNEAEAKQNTISRQSNQRDPMGLKNTIAKPENWLTALDEADTLPVKDFKGTPQVEQSTSMPVWTANVGERANRKSKDAVTSIDSDGNENKKKGTDLSEEEWGLLGGAFISEDITIKEEEIDVHFTAEIKKDPKIGTHLLINHTGAKPK